MEELRTLARSICRFDLLVEAVVEMNESPTAELMHRANLALQSGKLDECLLATRKLLEIQPRHVPALIISGIAAYRQERLDLALSFFSRAKATDPNCGPAFLWSSMTLRRCGDHMKALDDARKALSLGSQDPVALHHVAQCLIELGQFAQALPILLRASAAAPSVAAVHSALAAVYHGLGNPSEALSSLRRAVRIDPQNLESLIRLRQLLVEEGDLRGAVAVAETVCQLQPDSADAILSLARIHLEDHRAQVASSLISRVLELDPNSALAHSLLGTVYRHKVGSVRLEASFSGRLNWILNRLRHIFPS